MKKLLMLLLLTSCREKIICEPYISDIACYMCARCEKAALDDDCMVITESGKKVTTKYWEIDKTNKKVCYSE